MVLPVLLAVVVAVVALSVLGSALAVLVHAALVGLVVGGLGRLVVPGRQDIGLLWTGLLGLSGALVGGVIGHAAHLGGLTRLLVEVGLAGVFVVVYSRRTQQLRPGPDHTSLHRW